MSYGNVSEQTVYISTLGTFELTLGEQKVSSDMDRSNRIWSFLAYLIMRGNKSVSQSELIDAFWPEDNNQNPGSSLKTLIYRTRIMLANTFGEDAQFIISQRGAYSWNSTYECVIDVNEFERLCALADKTDTPKKERLLYYSQAFALYHGDFLPRLSSELWVIPLATHYHNIFTQSIGHYVELLFEAGRYSDAVDVCTKASMIEAYDENIHALLATAYLRQGNVVAALSHYETATDFLYRNLGVHPSERLRSVYMDIMQNYTGLETDLESICSHLNEPDAIDGGFVCDYGFFRQVYRLDARRLARIGSCAHLALITLAPKKSDLSSLGLLNESMGRLLHILRSTLRRGDVISRYSGAQYVLLLPSSNYEDSEMILGRILSDFRKVAPRQGQGLNITFKIQQLDCVV